MISVITPVYNGERFIESCIQVVINQKCSDFEHIIVDGRSSDKTVDIIKQYAEKYSHIRIGTGTTIGDNCTLDGRGGLSIGNQCQSFF